jgi:YVTN family beta-propeller protein
MISVASQAAGLFAAASYSPALPRAHAANSAATSVQTVAGNPTVPQPDNLYSEVRTDKFALGVKDDLSRVYVPNLRGNSVSVIDPVSLKVVDKFKVGRSPQHIVPSWDLRIRRLAGQN